MRHWNHHGWWLLALAGLACAVDVPPPKVAQLTPASVQGQGLTATLAVDRIKSALLAGDELGHVSLGMFCAGNQTIRVGDDFIKNYGTYEASVVNQTLKKHGYTLATLGKSTAFDTDLAAAPDFRIGGILKEARSETCRTGLDAEGWIYLKIDWALYSEREQKVVFQLTTEGLAQSTDKVPDLNRRAVVSTVENFIGSPQFAAAIKAASPGAAAANPSPVPDTKVAPLAVKPGDPALPPTVTQLTPVKLADKALSVKLAVDPVKVGMLAGDPMGHASSGMFCSNSRPLTVNDSLIKTHGAYMATVANQVLKKYGYPLSGNTTKANAFDNEVAAPPDFRLGGILRDFKIEVCEIGSQAEGWIYMRVDWALYSEKAKRVVWQQPTESVFKSATKVTEMVAKAITANVENLIAAPQLLANLEAPPPVATAAAAGAAASASAAPASGPTTGRLVMVGGEKPIGGAQKNQARLRAAVVTLETALGTGSGFYIDKQGYLLTNFHVVNGSKFVKVKLPNGDKMVAEVVRVNQREDVALLKSLPIEFDALAVRSNAIDVGEEVYAIGTPLGVLDNTLTRGVLSADRVSQGVHILQSDAAVTFGSSGGPLLDGDGRVIGLTKGGLRGEKGFNFFVPITEAVRALDLSFTGAP